MLVDDNAFNIYGLKLILSKYKNIELHEAYNGKEAIEILLKNQ